VNFGEFYPFRSLSASAIEVAMPFRRLAENISQCVWIASLDGRLGYANGALLRHLGLSASAASDRAWNDALHPEDAAIWSKSWSTAVESSAAGEVIVRIRASDGSYQRYLVRYEPIFDPEQNSIYWLGVCTAVSSASQKNISPSDADPSAKQEPFRAKDECNAIPIDVASLWESEAFVRDVLNSLPEHIVVLDEQGVVCAVNELWLRFGRENEAVTNSVTVGVNYLDVCRRSSEAGDKDAAEVLEKLQDLLAGRIDRCVVEYPCPSPDCERWYLMHAQRLIHGSRGAILSHVDITERKRAEEAVRESEERFRVMADGLPLIVWLHDAEGNLDFVNQTFCDYFGVKREEMIEGRWRVLTHPEDTEGYAKEFLSCVRKRCPFHREVRVCRKDGQWRWMESWARPWLNQEGVYLGHIGTSADVTEHKQAEEALRDQDKRKDEFLATLAHELRNPLAPIRTGLEVMKLAKNDPMVMEETRQTMERQTQQLITLVNDLLDVSRITQGKFQLRKCRVALSDVMQSAVEASRPFLDEAKHHLAVSIPEQPVYLEVDPNRMAQVLSNLLNNSAKYTPEGGHISIVVDRQGSDIVFAIRDDGIGIPVELQHRVFSMFAQITRPGETGYTGLGIGLSLAKSLVEMHGGSIQVASDGVNCGATFTIRLSIPIDSSETKKSGPPSASTEYPRKKRRVLVVDDNTAAARTLSIVVKMLGNEVRTAGDGREACAVAAEFRPEVILMDIGMPKMNGYEAARWIRQQSWGNDITLVALTGWGQEDDKIRTNEAGFDHHLVKPAEPADLERILGNQSEGDIKHAR